MVFELVAFDVHCTLKNIFVYLVVLRRVLGRARRKPVLSNNAVRNIVSTIESHQHHPYFSNAAWYSTVVIIAAAFSYMVDADPLGSSRYILTDILTSVSRVALHHPK